MIILIILIIILYIIYKKNQIICGYPEIISGDNRIIQLLSNLDILHKRFCCYENHIQDSNMINEIRKKTTVYIPITKKIKLKNNSTIGLTYFNLKDGNPILFYLHGCPFKGYYPKELIQLVKKNNWGFVCIIRSGYQNIKLTTPIFNLYGDYNEHNEVIMDFKKEYSNSKFMLLAYSSSTATAENYFGYKGYKNPFIGGFIISPGYEFNTELSNIDYFYSKLIYKWVYKNIIKNNLEIFKQRKDIDNCLENKNFKYFEKNCLHLLAGCKTREEYNKKFNPIFRSKSIRRPLVLLSSENDKILKIEGMYNNVNHLIKTPYVAIIKTNCGSHGVFNNEYGNSWLYKLLDNYYNELLSL